MPTWQSNRKTRLGTGSAIPEKTKDAMIILEKAGIKLGVNWQKELTELINDISVRDNTTCLQVIESSTIKAILNDNNLSSPHKRARIKKELQRQRYPLFSQAKQEFKRQLKALNLSSKIKVKAAPYFESNQLSIEYKAEDEKELKLIEADINKLKEAELVKKTIDYVEAKI